MHLALERILLCRISKGMSHSHESNRIAKAFLTSLNEGVIELLHDWKASRMPPISLRGKLLGHLKLHPLPASDFASESRYFVDQDGQGVFVFDPNEYPAINYESTSIYVAGAFNGWQHAVGDSSWRMSFESLMGKRVLTLRCDLEKINCEEDCLFKFVTEHHHWLAVDAEAPNAIRDSDGNYNYRFSSRISGRHRFGFLLRKPVDLSENNYLVYRARNETQRVYLSPGSFFFDLKSDKPLGAIIEGEQTVFRLFAPRAKWVKVGYFNDLSRPKDADWVLMRKDKNFVWEATIGQNLAGHYYWFKLDGPNSAYSHFDPNFDILDPYAKATVSRHGPGIIIDQSVYHGFEYPDFHCPQWQDLIILEAHTQDLVANLSEANNGKESRPGFKELSAYSQREDFYPRRLGVNAIELQPVQENDSRSRDEYHWGYMTSNFFSPASSYASNPEQGSQIEEFRELVSNIRKQGMAVILDVVYNHVGEPAHLMYIDKLYYFHLAADGSLTNWSGCGNDLRCDAPMAKRIIIESLKHLVEFYGVDGFRFDLADLVGKAVLQEIECELKTIRPDIILIAEPWSFRGHIGMELRDTGYASWNDGYREFVRHYICGEGSRESLEYFLKGSPEYYAYWPAQTVNYVESHDDRVWIDMITENLDGDGFAPTAKDMRRTCMMIGLLMMSIGVPMLHAGMDFMATKRGVRNTYQRGDLNALDYHRILDFASVSSYFREWIAFRKSKLGGLLRHFSRVGDDFYYFIHPSGSNGLVCVYNASGNYGSHRLLFAINPDEEASIAMLEHWADCEWRQLANHERFLGEDLFSMENEAGDQLYLPPLSIGLWISDI